MAVLASKDLTTAKKVTPSGAGPGATAITGLRFQCLINWASLAFACKSETFRSLYGYALLILGESSKCKRWSAA